MDAIKFAMAAIMIGAAHSPAHADTIKLDGKMQLWSNSQCASGEGLCGIPQPLAPAWPVTTSFSRPTRPGQYLVTDQIFRSSIWKIHLTQYWMEKASPDVSYLVTQVVLSKDTLLLATCSRYDGVDALSFLPPGACAGRDGDRMIGVSLSRN